MATAPETLNRTYDVGGVLLERPFRVLRLGHFGFNVEDQEKALRFYSDLLGLPVTDTVDFGKQFNVTSPTGQDPNGYFLRVGADHHSVVLFPHWAFAATPAPKREGTTWISHMAWQVATLREVTEGRRWLTDRQVRIARPGGRDARGANWNFTVTDADAISNEIYYGMDQIGWDGVSKPVSICPAGDALPAPEGAARPISRWRGRPSKAGSTSAWGCTSAPSASPNTMSPGPCWRARSASCATGRSASSRGMSRRRRAFMPTPWA